MELQQLAALLLGASSSMRGYGRQITSELSHKYRELIGDKSFREENSIYVRREDSVSSKIVEAVENQKRYVLVASGAWTGRFSVPKSIEVIGGWDDEFSLFDMLLHPTLLIGQTDVLVVAQGSITGCVLISGESYLAKGGGVTRGNFKSVPKSTIDEMMGGRGSEDSTLAGNIIFLKD